MTKLGSKWGDLDQLMIQYPFLLGAVWHLGVHCPVSYH